MVRDGAAGRLRRCPRRHMAGVLRSRRPATTLAFRAPSASPLVMGHRCTRVSSRTPNRALTEPTCLRPRSLLLVRLASERRPTPEQKRRGLRSNLDSPQLGMGGEVRPCQFSG